MLMVLGGAIAVGAHPGVVSVVGLGVYRPDLFLAGCAVWAAVARFREDPRPGSGEEARFLQGMSAELASGASLRSAIAAAAERTPRLDLGRAVRVATAGSPMGDVAESLRSALPLNGRLVAPALRMASATGGSAAVVFGGLAVRASEHGELARERRALTAQARLSALVVAGAPLALAGVVRATGGFSVGSSGNLGTAVVGVGLSLEAMGALAVWWMIRRADR